jgi:hypothetical protein
MCLEMSPGQRDLFARISGLKAIFANRGRWEATTLAHLVTSEKDVPISRAINADAPSIVQLRMPHPDTEHALIAQR